MVNLSQLAGLPDERKITAQVLAEAGLVKSVKKPVKVLGRGEIDRPLEVEAHRFSKSAREKIEAAGGSARAVG